MGVSPSAGHPILVATGRRIRAQRKALSLSQEKLADRCGVHWSYISQIERGVRNVSLLNLVRIARALGLDPGKLLEGVDGAAP